MPSQLRGTVLLSAKVLLTVSYSNEGNRGEPVC